MTGDAVTPNSQHAGVLRNFVNGEYVDVKSGRTSNVIDPSTGEVYAQAPVSGAEDVDAALREAAAAYGSWRGVHRPLRPSTRRRDQ